MCGAVAIEEESEMGDLQLFRRQIPERLKLDAQNVRRIGGGVADLRRRSRYQGCSSDPDRPDSDLIRRAERTLKTLSRSRKKRGSRGYHRRLGRP